MSSTELVHVTEHVAPSSTGRGLGVLATAALLVADNVGTGVLALPGQIANIGRLWGLLLLVIMVAPNVYAGLLLHRAASMSRRARSTRAPIVRRCCARTACATTRRSPRRSTGPPAS